MFSKKNKKNTVVWWVALCSTSILLFVAEICNWNRLFDLNQTIFWTNIVTPFCNDLDTNLINLFVSQISSTFLITAFLSFLSDKEDPIYWTTAMEYKLIKPAGTSLRNIMEYCLGTLVISLIAVFTRTKLMFLFAFIANLVGLSMITFRMIFAFFSRNAMKKQLQKEFIDASYAEREQMLLDMETYIIDAAHNHNVAYLRECIDFFREFEKKRIIAFNDSYVLKMIWFFQIIPEQLSEIRLDILKILCSYLNINELIQSTSIQRDDARRRHLTARIENELQNTRTEDNKDAQAAYVVLRNKRENIQNGILMLVRNQIENGSLTDRDTALWQDAAIAFFQLELEECFITAMKRDNRPYLGNIPGNCLDLSWHFKKFVFLLEHAHYHHRILDSYIIILKDLHKLVVQGAQHLYDCGLDVNKNVRESLKESERNKVPTTLRDAIHCYNWDETRIIFKCLCDKDALIQIENNVLGLLYDVLNYSKGLTSKQKIELVAMVNNAGHMDDYNKSHLITTLMSTENA